MSSERSCGTSHSPAPRAKTDCALDSFGVELEGARERRAASYHVEITVEQQDGRIRRIHQRQSQAVGDDGRKCGVVSHGARALPGRALKNGIDRRTKAAALISVNL